jgi:hypothetical protein
MMFSCLTVEDELQVRNWTCRNSSHCVRQCLTPVPLNAHIHLQYSSCFSLVWSLSTKTKKKATCLLHFTPLHSTHKLIHTLVSRKVLNLTSQRVKSIFTNSLFLVKFVLLLRTGYLLINYWLK